MTQDDALPGLDVLLGAPMSSLSRVYPAPTSFGGRQVGPHDLYQAVVTIRPPQKGTAHSHHSCLHGLTPWHISKPTRSHAAATCRASAGLAPRWPLGTRRCGVAVSPAAGTQTAWGPSAQGPGSCGRRNLGNTSPNLPLCSLEQTFIYAAGGGKK